MADKARLQIRTTLDPEAWSDVGTGTAGVGIPVEVESSALPSGAATSLNQTNGNQQSKIIVVDENGVQSQMLGDTYYAGSQIVIDVDHHEIHCGDMVTMTHTADLTNGAVRDILIVTPNPAVTSKRYHAYIEVLTELEADLKLYETVTASNNGTPIVAYNRNRQDPVAVPANEVTFFHTPTVSDTGTLIEDTHWGSGRSTGGGSRGQNEWVLKNNTKYLLRLTNSTANNNYVSIKISYYVHPGI